MPKYSFSLLVFILYSNICFFEIQRKMMLHIFQNWMIKLCQNLIHYLKAVNYLKKVVFRLVLSFSSYTIQSGLKKLFGWLHSILGLRVGSVGRDIFFNFGEGQSCSQGLTAFQQKVGRGKKNFYPRLSLQQIVIRLWLISATRGYDLTSEAQTLDELS